MRIPCPRNQKLEGASLRGSVFTGMGQGGLGGRMLGSCCSGHPGTQRMGGYDDRLNERERRA